MSMTEIHGGGGTSDLSHQRPSASIDTPRISVLESNNGKSMTWKNGLGTTSEIAIFPPHKDFQKDDFIWRLSSSEILDSCSFSVFPGYDIALLLLPEKGANVQPRGNIHSSPAILTHNDQETGVPFKPLIPYTYNGEWTTQCHVKSAPLNHLTFITNNRFTNVSITLETICPHGFAGDGHCDIDSDHESGSVTPIRPSTPELILKSKIRTLSTQTVTKDEEPDAAVQVDGDVDKKTTNAETDRILSSLVDMKESLPDFGKNNSKKGPANSKMLLGHFMIVHVITGSVHIDIDGDVEKTRIVKSGQTLICERHDESAPTEYSITPVNPKKLPLPSGLKGVQRFNLLFINDNNLFLFKEHHDATLVVIQISLKRERTTSFLENTQSASTVSLSNFSRMSRRNSIIVYDESPSRISRLESQASFPDEMKSPSNVPIGYTTSGLPVKFWESARHYRPPIFSARYQNESDVPPPEVRDTLVIDEFPKGKISTLWINMVKQGLSEWIKLPVIVARGAEEGPVVGITAVVHGNELNGVPCIHRVITDIDVNHLKGTVVAVPCVNVPGYLRFMREFSDGKDLNRAFPGSETGTASQIFAYALMTKIINNFNYLIDLHTASFGRVNSYYVRSDMNDQVSATLAKLQQPQIILHNSGQDGTLRSAAMARGIKAITVEIGNPQLFQTQYVQWSYMGVMRILSYLNMFTMDSRNMQDDIDNAEKDKADAMPSASATATTPAPTTLVCSKGFWIYTKTGGVLEVYPSVNTVMRKGDLIARIKNIFGNIVDEIYAPCNGVTIGRSSNPVAMAGDRVLHMGEPNADIDNDIPGPTELQVNFVDVQQHETNLEIQSVNNEPAHLTASGSTDSSSSESEPEFPNQQENSSNWNLIQNKSNSGFKVQLNRSISNIRDFAESIIGGNTNFGKDPIKVFVGTWNLNGKIPPTNLTNFVKLNCESDSFANPKKPQGNSSSFQSLYSLAKAGHHPRSRYHLVVIGVQEYPLKLETMPFVRAATQRQSFSFFVRRKDSAVNSGEAGNEWEARLIEAVGDKYELVKTETMGTLHIAVFIAKWSKKRIKSTKSLAYIFIKLTPKNLGIETGRIATGKNKALGYKGAVAIGLTYENKTILFVNCHFSAHQEKVNERNLNFNTTNEELVLTNVQSERTVIQTISEQQEEESDGQPANISDRYDYIFWFGDLNYRINLSRSEADELLSKKNFKDMFSKDQLTKELKNGSIFPKYREAPITFPPTFKFDIPEKSRFNFRGAASSSTTPVSPESFFPLQQENRVYDSSSKARVPSWTDRILFRCNDQGSSAEVMTYRYDACMDMPGSDHVPVIGDFAIIR
ncbi:hypothetical protein HK098_006750 [Nowakowskiella sp. JEL0407]|nr:hypothetical protein HK098_006750 [Nowakowskiella sp. JEL0407]